MPYAFLDDAPPADVGFEAWGASLDECFQAAADATLETMLANPDALRDRERRRVHVASEELDLALLRFLEEIVFHKDAEGLLLRATAVRVAREGSRWTVEATLCGERVDPARHELANDVKAVTVHRLRVARTDTGWKADVVLDV